MGTANDAGAATVTAEDWHAIAAWILGYAAIALASWWAGYMQAQKQAAKHPLDDLGERP